jgi:4-aminobutyrate aminotransferase / (S)-3-amino-2-methylpropionate transaminase / 5-aminovalerate transaminase
MTTIDESEIRHLEQLYCSQGDTSGKRRKKKYFNRGFGSFLYDKYGTPYLDFQMTNSSANFGYQSDIHLQAMERQIRRLPSLASEFMHEERVLLSVRLCKCIEDTFSVKGRIHFSVGGAQAVDDALRIVANFTGTRNVFAFEGSYHGRTIAASTISSSYRYRKHFQSNDQTKFMPFPYCYRCAYGKQYPSCDYHCVSHFDRLFQSEYHTVYDSQSRRSEYRAYFLEPVLGRGGYVVPPPEYYKRIKETLDSQNILLVVDEVQMGFFRTGKMWSIEHFGVVPDIIIFGKAITNGLYPLSGIWAKEELISPAIWPPGSSHATFAAQPLGTAAGMATFELLSQHNFEQLIAEKSARLKEVLLKIQSRFGIFGRIDSLGLAFGLEVCSPGTDTPDPTLAKQISEMALNEPADIGGQEYGLILTTGGYHDHVFLLSPSLLIEDAEIELFSKLLTHYIERSLSQRSS